MPVTRAVDLRSDTLTLPTQGMRAAMAEAELGDDFYGEDPTVRALEETVADLLGKEKALFVPSGTMGNQLGLRVLTEPGDQVLAEASAHIFMLEGGAPALISGVALRPITGSNGIFGTAELAIALPDLPPYMVDTVVAPTRLICLENTHNMAGGTVWPIETLEAVLHEARSRGLAAHLDGARLWNASIRTGVAEADYGRGFDSVSVCFSKGLGAPVGSALAGSKQLIHRARRYRQAFGGGMRQAGVIAAAALYALTQQRERLAEDHENAERFAAGLAQIPGIEIDPELVQTNIVRFGTVSMPAGEFLARCGEAGLRLIPIGAQNFRAVTRLGIDREDVDHALGVIRGVLRELDG